MGDVDALAGKWTMQISMTMPGGKPVKFDEKLDCKKVSGGRSVSCPDTAKVPGLGQMDFTHLIAYDPERKQVHWFAVGSTGEVHDHACKWTDATTLDCEPLKATMEGKPITETVKMTFEGNKSSWSGTTKTADGDIVVTGTGKRGG